jgi:hypothetical protein
MRAFLASDYADVAAWYRARGESPPPADSLPTLGRIEPGVAALFAYRTDSTVALLEGAITNPGAPARRRGAAVSAMTEDLLEELRGYGYRHAVVTTRSAGVRRFVERLGFKESGRFVMLGRAI